MGLLLSSSSLPASSSVVAVRLANTSDEHVELADDTRLNTLKLRGASLLWSVAGVNA